MARESPVRHALVCLRTLMLYWSPAPGTYRTHVTYGEYEMLCNKGVHEVPPGSTGGRCKQCRAAYNKEYGAEYRKTRKSEAAARSRAWAANNPERAAARRARYLVRIRREVFEHYGWTCVCCGYADSRFLTLDHANGNGGQERIARYGANSGGAKNTIQQTYYDYRKQGRWRDDLQVMCWNCNCAKGNGPWCPHEEPLPCQI